MKKLVVILAVVVSFFTNVSKAQQPWMLTREDYKTMDIDAAWGTEPFMKNTLPVDKQIINCGEGGEMRLFVGKENSVDVRMCRIHMPDIIESQTTSLQLVVNGSQLINCPIKLSYQVFSEPKIIGGVVVVEASEGMYNHSHAHFYMVVRPSGNVYITDVRQKKTK